jgi:hypothetical protein
MRPLLVLAFLGSLSLGIGCPGGGHQRPQPGPDAPQIGKEYPPPGEAAAQEATIKVIEDLLTRQHPAHDPMVRDAHPKHHGCVRAQLIVRDDVPTALQHGVFVPGQRYDAWVRFSNSSRRIQADSVGDGRGIAIKLLGVPGDKILDEEKHEQTQDFLMINHPAFFVKDAVQYAQFVQSDAMDNPVGFFIGLKDPRDWHLRGLTVASAILGQSITSPLETTYWSMTPYRLGPEVQAVKYRAKPCEPSQTAIPKPPGYNYLRDAMATTLAARDACFDLAVQLQTDPVRMPMEDATITWDERQSPFLTVARLLIPAQTFETKGQMRFCEDLSYTPWHSLPAHRPLGSLNRIRKDVYQAISKLRHAHNHTPRTEPTSLTLPAD